uniref:Uncharacterized protein n=1 Tax=Brassica oleracea TaxID=3712 RepID=A0A3P6BDQ4_BRAOL|nr:unnamed protein product [Brassica oleracea]
MAAEHHVYLAVVEKKFRSCTIAGREEEMRRNEKSGLQRWKKRRAAKSKIISGDSLIIQTKPKRLINDTHLTPRRFSLTIKGLVTALTPSMCSCSDSGKLILVNRHASHHECSPASHLQRPSPGWFTGATRTSGFQTCF